jgi:thiol-disulfide isomerase/thioredoxin
MFSFANYKNKMPALSLSKMHMFLIIIIAIIFLLLTVYMYKHYIKARIHPTYVANREYTGAVNSQGGNAVDIYFFYTTWCPHCKHAMPVWKQFKNEMTDATVKGNKLNFFEVDCDKEKQLADKFNVKGYPTIKLVKGNQVIEYDAKPNVDTLREFINTSL